MLEVLSYRWGLWTYSTLSGHRGRRGPVISRITRRLIDHYSQPTPPDATSRRSIERLTARETQLLLFVARGLTNAEIATQHHISLFPTKTTGAACWPSWTHATASS